MIYEAPKEKYAINYGSRLPTNPLSGRISSTTVTVLYVLAFVLFVQFLAGALLHKYDVYSAFPFSALGMNFLDICIDSIALKMSLSRPHRERG